MEEKKLVGRDVVKPEKSIDGKELWETIINIPLESWGVSKARVKAGEKCPFCLISREGVIHLVLAESKAKDRVDLIVDDQVVLTYRPEGDEVDLLVNKICMYRNNRNIRMRNKRLRNVLASFK